MVFFIELCMKEYHFAHLNIVAMFFVSLIRSQYFPKISKLNLIFLLNETSKILVKKNIMILIVLRNASPVYKCQQYWLCVCIFHWKPLWNRLDLHHNETVCVRSNRDLLHKSLEGLTLIFLLFLVSFRILLMFDKSCNP